MPAPSTAGAPQHTSATSSASPLPYGGAPRVPKPVDVSRFKSQPCTTLTARQLGTLGISATPVSEPDSATGPACSWRGGPDSVNVAITFLSNTDGLSSLYVQSKQNGAQVFEAQQPVNGFPAVLALVDDRRTNGECSYSVGVNDHDVLFVQLTERSGGDPCGDVRQVALSATKTIGSEG